MPVVGNLFRMMWGPCPACGRELDSGDRPVDCEPWNGKWLIVGGEKLGLEDEVSLDTGRSSSDSDEVEWRRMTRGEPYTGVFLDNSSSSNDVDLSVAPAPQRWAVPAWKAPPPPLPCHGFYQPPPPYKAVPKQCPAGEWRAAAPPPYKAVPKQFPGTCRALPNPPPYKEPPKEALAGTWNAAPKKAPPDPWGA